MNEAFALLYRDLAVLMQAQISLEGNSVAATPQSKEELGTITVSHRVHAPEGDLGHYQGRLGGKLTPGSHHVLVVAHVTTLTRRLDPLEFLGDVLVRAPVAEVPQAVLGVPEDAQVDEEDADHGAGSSLAALAVHGDHVLLILLHPRFHAGAESQHVCQRRHVVIVDEEPLHPPVEQRLIVVTLRTQVVDAIMSRVLGVHEPHHFLNIIPVHGHPPTGREGHGDDPRHDVGEVKVKAVLLVPPLVLGHELPRAHLEVLSLPDDPRDSHQTDQSQDHDQADGVGRHVLHADGHDGEDEGEHDEETVENIVPGPEEHLRPESEYPERDFDHEIGGERE